MNKLFPKFKAAYPDAVLPWEKLRTHSGRTTRLTLLIGEGVSLAISMRYARHASASIKTHLRYGRLTTSHIHKYFLEERHRLAGLQHASTSAIAIAKAGDRAVSECGCGTVTATAADWLADCTLAKLVEWYEMGLLEPGGVRHCQSAAALLPELSENLMARTIWAAVQVKLHGFTRLVQ